jgi:hypothetical protein
MGKRRTRETYTLHQAALLNNALQFKTLERSVLRSDMETLRRIEPSQMHPKQFKSTLCGMFRRSQQNQENHIIKALKFLSLRSEA